MNIYIFLIIYFRPTTAWRYDVIVTSQTHYCLPVLGNFHTSLGNRAIIIILVNIYYTCVSAESIYSK